MSETCRRDLSSAGWTKRWTRNSACDNTQRVASCQRMMLKGCALPAAGHLQRLLVRPILLVLIERVSKRPLTWRLVCAHGLLGLIVAPTAFSVASVNLGGRRERGAGVSQTERTEVQPSRVPLVRTDCSWLCSGLRCTRLCSFAATASPCPAGPSLPGTLMIPTGRPPSG